MPLKECQDIVSSIDITIQVMKKKPTLNHPIESHILKSNDQEDRALICKYHDGGLSIDYFECGFFYLKNQILYIYSQHPDPAFFEAILTTQILPLASSLFRVTLHGGVVVKNHRAAIYLGQEGAGKSTLTTYLSQKGYTIFSDDTAAIERDLTVLPGLPEIRINKDSCQELLSSQQIQTLQQKLAKQQISIPQVSFKNAKICAIFLLNPTDSSLVNTQSVLTSTQRFSTLIENQFRWDLWSSQALQTDFSVLTELCQKIPLLRLDYQFQYDSLPWIELQIERSLHDHENHHYL